jgi:exopolysaccharide biosynthesis predicted pyruvyltransferase EpsI
MNRRLETLSPLLPDLSAWQPLRSALLALHARRPERLLYVPNEGNAGDALIAAGSFQFFDDLGIRPQHATLRDIRAGDAVLYGGGGNLVPEYQSCQWFLERCLAANVEAALVMPQTIRGHEALLAGLDARFTLVCRDVASLDRVNRTGTRAQVLFTPDMALYVDVARLFQRCERYTGPGFWWRMAHHDRLAPYWRWRWQLSRRVPPSSGALSMMRVDAEAAGEVGTRWWDLSHLYGSRFPLREETDLVSRDFLRFFEGLTHVRTNRLHAGVAAALMGCEVTYLDNSYGKIGAVYDAWMSHLPKVRFERRNAALPGAAAPLSARLAQGVGT